MADAFASARVGARVVLHGLVSRPEKNGCTGHIRTVIAGTGRAGVDIDGEAKLLSVRLENLRLADDITWLLDLPDELLNAIALCCSTPRTLAALRVSCSRLLRFASDAMNNPAWRVRSGAEISMWKARRFGAQEFVVPNRRVRGDPEHVTLVVDVCGGKLIAFYHDHQTASVWDVAATPAVQTNQFQHVARISRAAITHGF